MNGVTLKTIDGSPQWTQETEAYFKTKGTATYFLNLKKPHDAISYHQHKYYRAVVLPTFVKARESKTGKYYHPDVVHIALKQEFGPKVSIGDKTYPKDSMASYDQKETSDFIESIKKILWEVFQVVLPEPTEVDYDAL